MAGILIWGALPSRGLASTPTSLSGIASGGEPRRIILPVNAAGTWTGLFGVIGFRGRIMLEAGDHPPQELDLKQAEKGLLFLDPDVDKAEEWILEFIPEDQDPVRKGAWWLDWVRTSPAPQTPNAEQPTQNQWLAQLRAVMNGAEPSVSPQDLAAGMAGAGLGESAFGVTRVLADHLWQKDQMEVARGLLIACLNQDEGAEPSPARAGLALDLGQKETLLGRFTEAAGHLGQAARWFASLDLPYLAAKAHHDVGFVHVITSDLDQASASYHEALLSYGEKPPERLYTILEMGWLERRRGHYDKGVQIFQDLLKRPETALDATLALEVYDRLGSTLGLAKRFEEGEAAYLKCLELIDQSKGEFEPSRYIVLMNMAYLYKHWPKPEQALQYADKALALYPKEIEQQGKVTVYWTKGSVLSDMGRNAEALEQFERCIAVAEGMRTKATGREGIQLFQSTFSKIEDVFHLCARLHQTRPEAGYDRRAFIIAERIRARILYQSVSGPLRPVKPNLQLDFGDLVAAMAEDQAEDRVPFNRSADGPAINAADLSPLAGLLAQDQALLMYFLGERAGYWWLWRGDDLHMGQLPPKAQIERLIPPWLNGVEHPSPIASDQRNHLALELSRLLLPRPELLAEVEHLYILPDGLLHRLPFAALPLEDNGNEPQFLVQDRSISYLPSISLGLLVRAQTQKPTHQPKGALVFTDPVFGPSDQRFRPPSAAPQKTQQEFPRLVHSDRERLVLTQRARNLSVTAFQGWDATLDKFQSLPLADYRLIHLATHALCVPEHPGLSGLVFSLLDPKGHDRKGYLSAAEIAQLNLNADLVVLSACRTADGPLFRGEGMMGLARAFLEAGAGGVLAGLWDMNDEATAVLMGHFYSALTRGEPSAAALRKAQLRMAQNERWSHPRYWAGFSLIGEDLSVFTPSR